MICYGDWFPLEISYIIFQFMCCYTTESSHRSHLDTPLPVFDQRDDFGFADETYLPVTSCAFQVWIIISNISQRRWWTACLWLCWFRICCELFWSEVLSINLTVFSNWLPHLHAKLCCSLSLSLFLSLGLPLFPQVTLQRTDKEL